MHKYRTTAVNLNKQLGCTVDQMTGNYIVETYEKHVYTKNYHTML